MTNDQLLFQAANAADQSVKICKAAWEARELPPAQAEELTKQSQLLHCASAELARRARETSAVAAEHRRPTEVSG